VSRRKAGFLLAALVLVVASLVAAGCGSSNKSNTSTGGAAATTPKSSAKGSIAVLLPDTQSSVRWEQFDRKYLDQSFTATDIKHTIVNAQGDPTQQRTQAEQALTNGAKVILLVDLDPGSGKSIIDLAHARGAKVIDYDRLTLGANADVYVSFNNVSVGKLQGQGLVKCIQDKGLKSPVVAELNGSPTDNNATLFAQGYNSVLDPKYKSGAYVKGPNQSVPAWDNQKALVIYKGMLLKTSNKIDAVAAANDGLANSVIAAEAAKHLKFVPVTGQDATSQGIQHILAGEQCMTVYKAVKKEANAAAQLAISLIKNQSAKGVNGKTNDGSRDVPSVLLTPVAVTKSNIASTVIKDGFLKWSDICTGKYAKLCPKH